jgi:hypothetical protein
VRAARAEAGLAADSIRVLEEIIVTGRAAGPRARFGGVDWTGFDQGGAARFWQTRPVELLASATLAPGSEQTALFTELVGVLSGAWRVGLGTALAVGLARGSDGTVDEEPDPGDADDDGSAAFRRFLAGGGNLSLAGYRPLLIGNASSSSHLVLLIPRAWVDIPTLSSTERVESFGAEMAAEYQYHRYRSEWVDDSLSRSEVPFLTLHARLAAATGPRAFHHALGRSTSRPLLYTVPTLNLNFAEGVRVGASFFYGFGSLQRHETIRLHLTIAPIRPDA